MFRVHTEPTTQHSTFFKAACSDRWNNTDTPNPIKLPEDDPDLFDFYLHCVYTKSTGTENVAEALDTTERRAQRQQRQKLLIKTHILADKLGDFITANLLLDALVDDYYKYRYVPGGHTIEFVFSNTPADSPLQRLLLDIYVYYAGSTAAGAALRSDEIPKSFVCAVLMEKIKLESDKWTSRICDVFDRDFAHKHRCRYRLHGENLPRCADDCEFAPSH